MARILAKRSWRQQEKGKSERDDKRGLPTSHSKRAVMLSTMFSGLLVGSTYLAPC